ncbi:MAG: hypothetical protein Q7T55_05935 [Solirubrobacteraceae bacterium]|nr:hypothetical protein [Solirubrobacteraceae bacterium]
MLHRRLLALALSLLFVAAPAAVVPTAFAASATQTGYDDADEVVPEEDDEEGVSPAEEEDTAEAQPSTTTSTGSLPFTGLEAGLIAAAGLGLVGTGLVLRRAAREQ